MASGARPASGGVASPPDTRDDASTSDLRAEEQGEPESTAVDEDSGDDNARGGGGEHEQEISEEEEVEEEGDEWEWQLRVVQRVGEALTDLGLFTSGGFDFVVMLNLQQNALTDLSPLVDMGRTLRVLNVSQNALATLPDASFWAHFRRLSLCFLSQNVLSAWADVEGLQACASSLRWLTLTDNPLMALQNARSFVVNKLPFLQALDGFATTDQEIIQHARPSSRFDAQAPRLSLEGLHMPLEFERDDDALRYVAETEAAVGRIFAHNSPSVRTQKLVRGYLSRRGNFPLFRDVRALVIHVQKHVRGFLLRQLLQRQLGELVAALGKPQLLMVPRAVGYADLSSLARRALEKLLPHVRNWRVRFQAKKRAVAVKKIRFWCQLMYQRHARRTQQLLREQQEVWIYYTPGFEQELLNLAARAARRDPFLMTLPREERLELLRTRCAGSGVSVLRGPSLYENVVRVASPPSATSPTAASKPPPRRRLYREEDVDEGVHHTQEVASRSSHEAGGGRPAVLRAFLSDAALEDRLLVAEKQFLQQDLERIAVLQSQHRQAVTSADQPETNCSRQPRAVMVHLAQVARELEQRLVICNRKILSACVKQQRRRRQAQHCQRFSLTTARIRARGHAPTRWERQQISSKLRRTVNNSCYPKMKVFIPWTIDMYLQIVTTLERAVSTYAVGPASTFALAYEDVRRADAALLLQSAWRASLCYSRRNALEVTLARALVCLQRWWRFRLGLRRRMDVLRACLLVGASVNSTTLFMEASVYHTLVDSWPSVQAAMGISRCHEHRLHCRMGPAARVELTLTPGQMLLRNASRNQRSILLPQHQQTSSPPAYASVSKVELWASQRCAAYLPVWLPGVPEHEEESMSSRFEDAAGLLLVDGVQAEPTVVERELMLSLTQPPVAEAFAQRNPFRDFAASRRVADAASRVMELARRLSEEHKQRRHWQLTPSQLALETTSFVRLTFDSVDEARKRALLLLCKTFDPVSGTYARMFPMEALVAAALRHHQWALSQVTKPDESDSVLEDSRDWLQHEFPSQWWTATERKLEALRATAAGAGAGAPLAASNSHTASQFTPMPAAAPTDRQLQHPVILPAATALAIPESSHPPFEQELRGPPRVFPRVRDTTAASGPRSPAPLHLIASVLPVEMEHQSDRKPLTDAGRHTEAFAHVHSPHPPPRASSSPAMVSVSGSNRHQLLTDRLGRPRYGCIEDMQYQEQQSRARLVRDLREERERAMEALIVERRMQQRENATEVAGLKLDVDVKLQRQRFQRELAKLDARELMDQQKVAARRRRLTRQFEASFAVQSGALMRRAARESVAQSLEAREREQVRLAASARARESEALARRRDAKSGWFVRNRQSKQDAEFVRRLQAAEAGDTARDRLAGRRQRIQEDKDIKRMLRLM